MPAVPSVALVAGPTVSGALPPAVRGLAEALRRRGAEVQVIPGCLPPTGADLSTRVRCCAAALGDAWAGQPPAVVHTRDAVEGLAALSAAPAGALHVHEPRGRLTQLQPGDDPDLLRLELLLLRQVDAVLARSHEELEALAARGIPRERLHLVPVGVDVERFSPTGPVLDRGDAGEDAPAPRVVTVADDLADGVDRIVYAVRGSNHVELLVAGGPAPERLADDPAARRLREFATRCGNAARVHLLGHVEHADLPALLRSADVVAQGGRSASGTAVAEAMACGRAVVALATPGAADAVVERTTGVLVDPRDDRGLRRELLELVADPLRQEGYGLAGVQRAAARHAWEVVVEATLRAYLSPVAEQSRSSASAPDPATG